ncbi:MAG: type ISP restriction/modification enzyme [Terracidiphilus sp.]|jgi:predicted helicase
MPTDRRDRLASIRRFDQLVAYLRDEMGWPIGSDDFEELTFEYTPEELGIDAANAAKIQEIKRLRPLEANQPWGIFFVKFEPKRLPVVALRRILGQVALKKRASANRSERQAWAADDLLFISNYGEGGERRIAFAHFAKSADGADLPTLKVLGWDNLDTPLHLDDVAEKLTHNLAWPDGDDSDAWRARWRDAFTLRHREVITTSKELSIRLAELARAIRDRIRTALAIENEKGPLTRLMKAFQTALVHDLDANGFADMYAQTIAYGLLSARITDPSKPTADDFAAHMRTNPFLRDLMETFLKVGGRRGKAGGPGIDFDELGVSEVVELLDDANMEAVVRDFGDRNPQEDPVIHFYEHFLAAYDKKQKVSRGVFYTPRPVVSYIVRSVDELLRTEFGLADGLADTTTWGEIAKRHKDLKIPEGVSPDQDFVQILDPATGTGTFLVEVIDLIHKTLVAKWMAQGHAEKRIDALWNEYVPKHLLTRLHGYELLMAPYAIAHLKIGLKLHETGYDFGSDERARVYLTNALEPAGDRQLKLDFLPALAHEAEAVNRIKQEQRFTAVIGNPPYSNFGQLNKIPFILNLLEDYKRGLDDKKINLDDDFIKFVRFSEAQLNKAGVGVHGMITNNAYLDGLTHRRMRRHLVESFPVARILNLHGSSKKKEKAPDGTPDENVFDITVGVAIGVFCRAMIARRPSVAYADLWGMREIKTKQLIGSGKPIPWMPLSPAPNNFFLVPKDFSSEEEYQTGWSISDAFSVWQNGLKTDRDELFFDLDKDVLDQRMRQFYGPKLALHFREQYQIVASSSYDIEARRLATKFSNTNIRRCLYRPMDVRWLYYDQNLTSRPAEKVMRHMLGGPNLGLIATRQTQEKWDVLATTHLCGHKSCAAYDINSLFPLYLYEETLAFDGGQKRIGFASDQSKRPNFSVAFLKALAAALKLPQKGVNGLPECVSPEDILYYAYSVFYSPGYRSRYAEFLKIDFPRLPLTGSLKMFRALARLGGELVALHLLESPQVASSITEYIGGRAPEVEKVSWSRNTVWIDKAQTIGFKGVREEVWNFHVGGYQVCDKWLKDRKGRKLYADDIRHYQKIVVAFSETIRLMKKIDEVIEQHGGWPGAFTTGRTTEGGA